MVLLVFNMYTCVEYVWIDLHSHYRSKCKVIPHLVECVSDVPEWNFDGSSTKQSTSEDNTEIVLNPVAIFNDPFRGSNHKIVLCDCYDTNHKPILSNTRHSSEIIFSMKKELEPWFGMEQEYFICDPKSGYPLGFHPNKKQGQYYCGNGTSNSFGRRLAEYHLKCCLEAGVEISGINAEVAPGQWEFQVGPCEGIDVGDHLHIARFLLIRCAENMQLSISFEPKLLKGAEWNGSGCHTNFSTKPMREGTSKKSGYHFIKKAIQKLENNHTYHMQYYGMGNRERLTGTNETGGYDEFSWSVGGRDVSVRVGNETFHNKKGYFEDRRPSSNCDPYIVSSLIFETCCIHDKDVFNMSNINKSKTLRSTTRII